MLVQELPAILPSTPGRRKQKGPGKIVCLKDPMGRIWPLLYRDDVFSVNWRILCERNRIKPGDECRFEAENETNSLLNSPVYRVDVIRSYGGQGILNCSLLMHSFQDCFRNVVHRYFRNFRTCVILTFCRLMCTVVCRNVVFTNLPYEKS